VANRVTSSWFAQQTAERDVRCSALAPRLLQDYSTWQVAEMVLFEHGPPGPPELVLVLALVAWQYAEPAVPAYPLSVVRRLLHEHLAEPSGLISSVAAICSLGFVSVEHLGLLVGHWQAVLAGHFAQKAIR